VKSQGAAIRVNGVQVGIATNMQVTFAEAPPSPLTREFKTSAFSSTYRARVVGAAIEGERLTGPATQDLAPDLPIWARNDGGGP
jgi:hypothetical protein